MRSDRLNEMEHYIFQHGHASVAELAERFQVSTNTVRRDMEELLKTGSIRRVSGGVEATRSERLIPLGWREQDHQEAKRTIGRMAAELLPDGSTVFLDTGTTVRAMVPYLAGKKGITIVTNSLHVIQQATRFGINLFALSGFYNHEISGFVGITVQDTLNRLSLDAAFLSATGVSLKGGLTVGGYFEDPIKRQILASCGKTSVLLADSSKFGRSALFAYGTLQELGAVITEQAPPQPYIDALRDWGVQLIFERKESHENAD